jgi:hypothetical protein
MNTSHPFAHRVNRDGTTDAICKKCFATVGTSEVAADLKELEGGHICDPWKLKVVEAVFTKTTADKVQT